MKGLKMLFEKRSVGVGKKVLLVYLAHVSAYVFPLLTLPYLSRSLGPDTYALVGVTQSAAIMLSVIGEYGFRYTSTREVALSRNRQEKLRSIVSATLMSQLLLLVPLVALTGILALLVPLFRLHLEMAIFASLIAISQALFPVWYFQGTERLEKASILQLSSRLVSLLGIFTLVSGPEDWRLALLSQFVGTLLSSGIAVYWMCREVGFTLVPWNVLKEKLLGGLPIFLSRASNTMYSSANSFIVSLVTDTYQTGLFAASERIVRPALSMLWPLTDILYPHSVRNLKDKPPSLRKNHALRRTLILIVTAGLFGGLTLYALAPWIILVILGEQFSEATLTLRISALLLPIVAFGSALSTQVMLPLRMDREFMYSVIVSGISNVFLAVLLAPRFGAPGMAIAVVIAEGIAAVIRLTTLLRRRYLL